VGYEAATSHGLRKKIYHQLHRTSSFSHRRRGLRGVIVRVIGWERSLSIFLLRLSRNSIGSGGQVSVCEQS
jgi:hypothetical protein